MSPEPGQRLIVVDASLVLKWQLDDEEDVAPAVAIRDDYLIRDTVNLAAPTLLVYELANGVWSAARRGRITEEIAPEALRNLLDCEIELHAPAGDRILTLALQHDITAYDAAYVSLAERLRAELWTADRPLYEAVAGSYGWVRWVADYGA